MRKMRRKFCKAIFLDLVWREVRMGVKGRLVIYMFGMREKKWESWLGLFVEKEKFLSFEFRIYLVLCLFSWQS